MRIKPLAIILLPTLRPRPHFRGCFENVVSFSYNATKVSFPHMKMNELFLFNIIMMTTYGKKTSMHPGHAPRPYRLRIRKDL